MNLLVVGDALLDEDVAGSADRLCSDAPAPVLAARRAQLRPGGAGLAALLAARDGADVVLVTALGADEDGARLRRLLEEAGVAVVDLGRDGETVRKTRLLADGRPIARVDRGRPGPPRAPSVDAREVLREHGDAVLVSDYGLGVPGEPEVARLLAERARRDAVVWDPHPRGGPPAPGSLPTPNLGEATRAASIDDAPEEPVTAACAAAEALLERWSVEQVCVTAGAAGAVLASTGAAPLVVAAPPATGDPCGAGDRLASRLAVGLAAGRSADAALRAAVGAASAFVGRDPEDRARPAPASGGGPRATPSEAERLAQAVHDRGGTLVAAGGCFDLLHAGHVATLQAARRLGDALVVCLNSDRSVRALKGPDRPIVPAEDRAAVLLALACVDAVEIFDDDTPVRLLERLRPRLFVKGGDYRAEELPETPVLARWGGRVVTVPTVAGRSTTSIVQEVRRVA